MTTPLSLNLPQTLTTQGAGLSGQNHGVESTATQKVAQQNQAASLTTITPPKEQEVKQWKVPSLKNFKLDPALQKANQNAYSHLQNILQLDGMYVEMQQPSEENLESIEITVKEQGSSKQLKSYNEQSVLQLYAHHHHRQSVIVDGKV